MFCHNIKIYEGIVLGLSDHTMSFYSFSAISLGAKAIENISLTTTTGLG